MSVSVAVCCLYLYLLNDLGARRICLLCALDLHCPAADSYLETVIVIGSGTADGISKTGVLCFETRTVTDLENVIFCPYPPLWALGFSHSLFVQQAR